MKNQKGLITVDFLFALVVVFGFSAVLFALTLTLTVAEITQYITFAAARNYVGSHISIVQQRKLAFAKYAELTNNPVFAPLFRNGWFVIAPEPLVGNLAENIPAYASSPKKTFEGVGTPFMARILDFRIPFLGATNPEGDGQGTGFQTFLASYLGRESTTNECINFTLQRWRAIRNLPVSGAAAYSSHNSDADYVTIVDNGC